MWITSKLARYRAVIGTIGLGPSLKFIALKLREIADVKKGIPPSYEPIPLSIKGYEHPFWIRKGSSDSQVFYQVFIGREYGFPMAGDPAKVRLVIDCGANVGYTSIFMLNRFPNARVIAVEPDPENAEAFRKNLGPYGSRVELIRSGIWSREAGLRLVRPDGPDNQWGIRVEEVAPGEPADLEATSIPAILDRSGMPGVDLLKIDIEGSEEVVFSANCDWLDRVANIAIELHGPECEAAFFRAMGGYRYKRSTSGELTVCTEIAPKGVNSGVSPQPASP